MKKALFLMLIASSTAFSQNCKFAKNEVDKFTGEKVVVTDYVNINKKFTSRHFFSHSLIKDKDGYGRVLKLTGGGQSLFMEKGSKCILLLSNDEQVTLLAEDSFKTDFKIIAGQTVSSINPVYLVDESFLTKIAEIGINAIRMETSERVYDSDFTEKDNKNLAKNINCIIKE